MTLHESRRTAAKDTEPMKNYASTKQPSVTQLGQRETLNSTSHPKKIESKQHQKRQSQALESKTPLNETEECQIEICLDSSIGSPVKEPIPNKQVS